MPWPGQSLLMHIYTSHDNFFKQRLKMPSLQKLVRESPKIATSARQQLSGIMADNLGFTSLPEPIRGLTVVSQGTRASA